ncbi:MAG: hypothetical protein H7Y13_12540 [Sphingobacteriaceae bacterium]|nr:hypothetical protein [Sphingobacteriaceae bacterium]
MKFSAFLLLVLILLEFGSCSQTPIPKDASVVDSIKTDGTLTDTSQQILADEQPEKATSNQQEIKIFKGLYISGNEVSTFRDCDNPSKVYWLEDESKKLSASYTKAEGFLAYPYESIYTEVKGYLKGKSNIGYAAEYENVIAVTEVITAKQKSFNTECIAYEFIALGNEPFWSLDIIPSEKIIALKDVGSEKTYVFPYKAAKSTGNTFTYEVSNDRKQLMRVLITKETCGDGMSDRKYNYSAQVTINGKTLKGCAIKKGDKLTMNP